MNLSDLDNHDDRYTKLINALEPRHAPETSMRFTPPALQRRRSFFSLLGRISRIAAVLIVGIGIGLCVVRPDYAIAARKVLELGLEKIRTSRECRKNDRKSAGLSPVDTAILSQLFQDDTRKVEKATFTVQFEALGETDQPIVLTQNEYMRRMKEMATMQPGMNFYGELPDSYQLVVNTEHPLVKSIREKADAALAATVQPLLDTIEARNADAEKIRKDAGDKALSAEDDQRVKDLEKEVADARSEQTKAITAYAAQAPEVSQLVDLALLGL